MEWFHCNRCFRRSGPKFSVSSCGHIFCDGCINPKQCNICRASCSYLPITDDMKPQEKVFFQDPLKLIQSRLEHLAQIAQFQRSQKERLTEYYKHKNVELERRLKDVTEQCYRVEKELKRENAELKRPLSQRRTSPSTGQMHATGAQRMSLPVAVTSPGQEDMEWFHCNRCFRRSGPKFSVSSCGHIFCDGCINPKQCNICRASCSYLPITDDMKPQEKVFFQDPLKLIQSRLEHLAQIAQFQRSQKERLTEYYKHKNVELERRLKDVTEQCYRVEKELKRENAELKRPLSQRRTSPSTGQMHATGAQRMSLPVAVTSPVAPRSGSRSHTGSAERRPRERDPRFSFTTPPGSATSVSSHSSLHDYESRTPTPPTRSDYHLSPDVFQQHFLSSVSLQSPRPRNGL